MSTLAFGQGVSTPTAATVPLIRSTFAPPAAPRLSGHTENCRRIRLMSRIRRRRLTTAARRLEGAARSSKGHIPGATLKVERVRCLRADSQSAPGRSGHRPRRYWGRRAGARGASLKRAAKAPVTPAHSIARSAAWAEGRRSLAGDKSRRGAPRGERARKRTVRASGSFVARAAPEAFAGGNIGRRGAAVPRLPALRLPFFREVPCGGLEQNSDASASRERDHITSSRARGGDG